MGTFYVTIGVAHPSGNGDCTEVTALVDTGATHTMLPASLLERLHIEPRSCRTLRYADGRTEILSAGEARISYEDEALTCLVVFGPEDVRLLGASALETLGFMVDPIGKKLIKEEYIARPF